MNETVTASTPPQSIPSIIDREIKGMPVVPDDRPWIPTTYGEQKYLRLSLATGEWVILARIHPGQPVPYHKHHCGLHLWILEGELHFVRRGLDSRARHLRRTSRRVTHIQS